MDQPWESEHAPSDCAKHPRWNTASTKPIEINAQRLQRNTRALAQIPYEPGLWLLRAQLLLAHGYPELAAGDAYKARLLVEATRRTDSELGVKVRMQYGMCLWLGWHQRFDPALGGLDPQFINASNIACEVAEGLDGYEQQAWSVLIIALQHTDCIEENQALAKEAATKFGSATSDDKGLWSEDFQEYLHHLLEAKKEACKVHPELAGDEYMTKKVMLNGAVVIRRYPWIQKARHLPIRNIDQLNQLVRDTSKGGCEVRKSNIDEADLGVFAAKSFSKGEDIVIDHTYMAASSEGGRCLVCCQQLPETTAAEQFCCADHFELARSKFPPNDRTVDVDFNELEKSGLVRNNTRNPLTDVLLLRRFLAIVTKHTNPSDADVHPLQVPEVACLAANYAGEVRFPWNFLQAVVLPLRILESLGIDLFADQRFDTWVIHTIWYRINNNQAGGFIDGFRGQNATAIQGVYPCHSLFNHSCEPNVTYDDHPTQAAQVMRAKRDIQKGEELYIAYDLGLDAEGMGVWERREALRNWMGGECKCARCVRERQQDDATVGSLHIGDAVED